MMTPPESHDRIGHAIRAQVSGSGGDAVATPPATRQQRKRRTAVVTVVTVTIALLVVSGTAIIRSRMQHPPAAIVPSGDPERGARAMAGIGCGFCHTIGGVRGARGKVGPPLDGMAERTFIAGQVPNTPDNLVRWIRDPQSIERGTAMPNLGVDETTARDIAAYLYTRR
jgi:cytochrome c2